MQRQTVYSSDIASIGYDYSTQTLEVQYKTGETYHYSMVPDYVYQGLANTTTHMDYIKSNIEGKYTALRV